MRKINALMSSLLACLVLGGACQGASANDLEDTFSQLVNKDMNFVLNDSPPLLAEEWVSSAPAEQGLDPAPLEELKERLGEESLIRSVLVARHGKLVLEYYQKGLGPDSLHSICSATKSFTSALIGIALKEGKIRSLDQPISDFFPEASEPGVDPRAAKVTVAQLLTMSSGFEQKEGKMFEDSLACRRSGKSDEECKNIADFEKPILEALKRPIAEPAGKHFNYDTQGSHLLSQLASRVSDMPANELLEEKLLKPLGVPRYFWMPNLTHKTFPGGRNLWLRSRDMLKFGQLYLQGGLWQGQQLIPADYVKASTRRQIGTRPPEDCLSDECRMTYQWANKGEDYGYQWWVSQTGDSFAAEGGNGGDQRIEVYPAFDLVIVITTNDILVKENSTGDGIAGKEPPSFIQAAIMESLQPETLDKK